MDNVSTIVLALSLIIIMLGMGLSLVLDDFKRIFIAPKAMITGLINQIVLLPLIGFLLIKMFALPPEIAIGIVILVACPGGPTSNLITHLAKGDLALSVSLTAITSFITLLTIPFIINLGLKMTLGQSTDIQLDIMQTIIQVLVIVIIPVIIGMVIRVARPDFADRMQQPVRIASAIVFVLVLLGIIIKEQDKIITYFKQAGTVTLILNLATMATGLLAAKIMRLPFRQGVSISIESGIQNGTLAISIATVLLLNTEYAIAPAVYSLIMFITGGIFIFIALRRGKETL
jgi:BASS family bile acid:Na+ symporter